MDTEQHSCEVCLDGPSVYILAIPCAHNETFCKSCVQNWLSTGGLSCPKCRAPWPESIESECGICRRRPTMSIPLIPCVHKDIFCVECIQRRIELGHLSCPRCYERWSENVVPPRADSNPMDRMGFPVIASSLADKLFVLSSIVLLATLIMYPTVMK
ncbi:unnamed protein product [Adineta ricciae]|uniref:RING-type domain-containing protein n=1 Tax=Adineta ricciae TaxID=249248 RepID=A0A814EVN0_ADIRI|nr:unnamed protein product [Adineta ricciae]